MDWKVFLVTFWAVFVAELADKTQLVGVGLAAKSGRPFSVWLGSIFAYAIMTVVSVLLGAVLGKYISAEVVRYLGSGLFIVIGALMLFKLI